MLFNFLPALGRIQTYPETDPGTILARFFEYAGTTPITVKSRNRTFGAASAGGSNVGNGTVVRLTKDRYNYNIESGADEAKTITCDQDEHSGARRWGELFTFRGAAVTKTTWPFGQQGGVQSGVRALSIADTAAVGVQNPGFETYDATNGFQGWTAVTAMSNFTQGTTRYYKDVLPNSTPAACIIATGVTDALYQTWSAAAINWNPLVPLYAQIAYMRRASATGTLYLQIGDQSVSVDISTKVNDEWNVLRFPAATPTTAAWFRTWNATNTAAAPATNPFVKIGVTSLATGTVEIDDLIVAPYTYFDGTWWAIVPGPTNSATTAGAATPFLKDDVFSPTDTSADVGKVQIFLAKNVPGFYMPSVTDASQTWAEPS